MKLDIERAADLANKAATIAQEYRALTGRPLGITGEVGELRAAQLLGLELAEARAPGFDACEILDGGKIFYQIKTRCQLADSARSQRTGRFKLTAGWDRALLVLLNDAFEATQIFEIEREKIEVLMTTSKSRAIQLGALSTSWFKKHGRLRWARDGA